jgi:curved DNA-binding protein CbpA
MFKDYYKLLDIQQNASDEEIKKAFREQAIKWHPDRNQGTDTTLRMQEINEAYLILKDREARARYDIEYNKFKQYQEQNRHSEKEKQKSDQQEWQKQEQKHQQTKREYEYRDYKVEDDILAKWMETAKKQAVDLAIQTIKDFKGVTKAAANGCVNGTIQLVIWVVVTNLIFFLVKSCNN